jgi:hypothetical protein
MSGTDGTFCYVEPASGRLAAKLARGPALWHTSTADGQPSPVPVGTRTLLTIGGLWEPPITGSVSLSVVAGCADVSRLVMIDAIEVVGTVFSGLSALVIEDLEGAGEGICVREDPGRGGGLPGVARRPPTCIDYHKRTAADVPADGRRVLVRVRFRPMRCLVCPRQTSASRACRSGSCR